MPGLLDLPIEIRALIIEYTVRSLPSSFIYPAVAYRFDPRDDGHGDKKTDPFWAKKVDCPSLLLICRSLHEESIRAIYENVTIVLNYRVMCTGFVTARPGLRYATSVDLTMKACFPQGCVWYDDSLPERIKWKLHRSMPRLQSLGLAFQDKPDWSIPLPALGLDDFLCNSSWATMLRRISLSIEGRNRYALQAFLQSSRVINPFARTRRKSILDVPYALLKLPALDTLILRMITTLSSPGHENEASGAQMQASNPRNGAVMRYTPSDFLIRNKQNQDFVIALKINDLFLASGKKVDILVKRCVWTAGVGGYTVEEKSLQQYNRERWASSTEFVSDCHSRAEPGEERRSSMSRLLVQDHESFMTSPYV